MTTITAADVKKLRDMTGAGMMDCKTALTETGGDIEAAVDWLRKKGLSKAAKKSGRIAADGLIGIVAKGREGAVVEVNSETDFVARNEQFQTLVRDIAGLAPAAKGDLKKLLAATYPGTKNTVETHVQEMVATIGENMTLRRTSALSVKEGVVADYVHNRVGRRSRQNRRTRCARERRRRADLVRGWPNARDARRGGKSACPRHFCRSCRSARAREGNSRRKEPGQEAGGSRKNYFWRPQTFAKENCLLEQQYIHDSTKTVAQAIKDAESRAGAAIKVVGLCAVCVG